MVAITKGYPRMDLEALARKLGVELPPALEDLRALYADVDLRNQGNVRDLDLPCHRGCDACCHESVFLTPLEFLGVWDFVQRELDDAIRDGMVRKGLRLYEENRDLILALLQKPPGGAADHLQIATQLKFRCPLLGRDGLCQVYSMRELYARLFGCSFNDEGGIYGCHLVGAHLAGRTVTLLPVRGTARRLQELPLTFMRQVYPYYINLLYGDRAAA